jgi:GT2 family glycosyltransferase
MGWEDVDYCIRVFLDGLECIYEPAARAIHHESVFRGATDVKDEWTNVSYQRLMAKYPQTDFGQFVPAVG